MKKNISIKSLIYTILLFLNYTNIYADNKIIPSLSIHGNFNWEKTDTAFCRIYYYTKSNLIISNTVTINSIYEEVYNKFKHFSKINYLENGLLTIIFLDDKIYFKITKNNQSATACWYINEIIINIDKPFNESTFRHELIHAVTLHSSDTKIKNCPGWFSEGIAMYYQDDINNNKIQNYCIKEIQKTFDNNELFPWNEIKTKSKTWGNDKRKLKYAESDLIIDYLINKYCEENIINIFYTDDDFYIILKKLTGMTIKELEKDWIEYIKIFKNKNNQP